MRTKWVAVGVAFLGVGLVQGQNLRVHRLPPELAQKVDALAQEVLATTGVPSASVAIVQGGEIVYTQAYGEARLDPNVAAEPRMRYSIGSISKQFTASAILMLEQQGKLTLDDPVSKWLPDLTDANQVTIRELLSHTSGYQDFWPEDYVMPPMMEPTTTQHILDTWAKKPLDFAPGTQWQYSNTNYVIAGRIAEMASGERLLPFLEQHIFGPLHMDQVWTGDPGQLPASDAEGFERHALGPPRPAPILAKGWMFAAMELSMPAYDLAEWDISVMNRSLLQPKSYDELEKPVLLKDGTNTHYALGMDVRTLNGHEELEHGGEVSGFVAENIVFPQDKVAIAVLTNEDASEAAGAIGHDLAPLLLAANPATTAAETRARTLFEDFQQGKIDRSVFTPWCNAYFDQQTVEDFQTSLAPLGAPASVTQVAEEPRGGMTFREFRVSFPNSNRVLLITTYTEPNGKLEQYLVFPPG